MPLGTGIVVIPGVTLPVVVPPVDGIAAVDILMPTSSLSGLVLNSRMTDTNGIAWIVTAIDGWDSPSVRSTVTNKGQDHGAYVEPVFYGPRLLIVRGTFASVRGVPTQTLMDTRDRLEAANNITGTNLAPFIVSELRPKLCMVQRVDGYHDRITGPTSYEFECHLLAPDPRKYDTVPTITIIPANTTVSISNYGNEESRPVLTVSGPASGITMENVTTGQAVAFAQILGPADTFLIDMNTPHRVLKNGATALYTIVSPPSGWWMLQPGVNQIRFTTTGSGSCSVSSRSAWI